MGLVSVNKQKLLRSILFFAIGVAVFWYLYQDIELLEFKNQFEKVKPAWIGLSIIINLMSQYVIALRWKMLIEPMGYNPKTINLFLAVLVLSFTNILIPRGGEIARGGVVAKYEKIPFAKVIGTVAIERITDLSALIILFFILLAWQFGRIQDLLAIPEFNLNINTSKYFIIGGIIAGVVLIIWLLFYVGVFNKFKHKLLKLKNEFMTGFKTIVKIKGTPVYVFYTFLIYFLWLMMLYVVFFAFEPTEHLGLGAAALTFGLSTLAFLLPIQAGMGAWHFVVIQCLLLLGITEDAGMVFALLAHTFTNLIFLLFGPIAFLLFVLFNGKKKRKKVPSGM
jgi:uncharacterized protein (TIRG00374 family)